MNNSIKEWADYIRYFDDGKEVELDLNDSDALPFVYRMKEKRSDIGLYGQGHGSGDANSPYGKDVGSISGRLWTKNKIISLWDYPDTKNEFLDIIKSLNENYKMDIKIDSSWKMDVPYVAVNYYYTKKSSTSWMDYKTSYLVPIHSWAPEILKNPKQYYDAAKAQKEKHTLSPSAKSGMPTDISVGSNKRTVGLSPGQRHQMQMTSDSEIKLKSLVEYTIGKISKQIDVKIDIDKSYHAGKQQNRPEGHTSDTEIIEIVKLALPEIANELMFDEINMGDYVLVKHKGTSINIVGALHPGQNDEIDFVVVTVMRKQNFMPKKGTKVIEV